eukprot:8696803-Pyramimonas_sp.AAC.1
MVPAAAGLAEFELVPKVVAAGRARVMHCSGLIPGGFALATVYLHHSEELGPRNWKILEDLGGVLKQIAMPFVLCGDFQLLPDTLEGSEWTDGMDAVCVAPSCATCTNSSASAGRCIDYFVMSRSLHHGAKAE